MFFLLLFAFWCLGVFGSCWVHLGVFGCVWVCFGFASVHLNVFGRFGVWVCVCVCFGLGI